MPALAFDWAAVRALFAAPAVAAPGDTLVVRLFVTLPAAKAATQIIPPAQRDTPSDSIAYLCTPADPIFDLDSLVVYGYPISGGGFRRVHAKSVRGREGRVDSTTLRLPGWQGGRFYATTKRIGIPRESCPSDQLYKGTVTGVELPDGIRRVVVEEWFDAHGRRLQGPTGTGKNFVRWSVRGRFIGSQTVPVVRGRVPAWFRLRRPTP
jgi:hypothetical protein